MIQHQFIHINITSLTAGPILLTVFKSYTVVLVFTKNNLTSEPFHKKGIVQVNFSALSLLESIKKMRHLGL